LKLAFSDSTGQSAVQRGDFPAFWSMALIAGGPESGRLYDLDLQREVQNKAWPSMSGGVLPAAYPPYVALVLKPLAGLDLQGARCLWTLSSLGAAFLAVCLFVRSNSKNIWAPWMVCGVLCVFTPALRGIFGGQVLSFIVCLFALTRWFERRNLLWADLALGVVLGVWLCKPYYALCALVVPVLQRRWVTLLAFMLVAALCWQGAVWVMGPAWFRAWMAFAREFGAINLQTNAYQMPNLWSQVYRLWGVLAMPEALQWAVMALAYLLLVVYVGSILGMRVVWLLLSDSRRYGDLLLLVSMSLVVVTMPQVNFYDLGIIACAVIALFSPHQARDWYFVGCCIVLSQISPVIAREVPLHFVLGILGLGYVCSRVRGEVLERAV